MITRFNSRNRVRSHPIPASDLILSACWVSPLLLGDPGLDLFAPLLSALRRAPGPGAVSEGDCGPELQEGVEVGRNVIDRDREGVEEEVKGSTLEVTGHLHQLGEVDAPDEKAEEGGFVGGFGADLRLGEEADDDAVPRQGEVAQRGDVGDPFRGGPPALDGAVGEESADVRAECRVCPAQALLRELGEDP